VPKRNDVIGLVLRRTAFPVVVGIAAGVGAAALLTRLARKPALRRQIFRSADSCGGSDGPAAAAVAACVMPRDAPRDWIHWQPCARNNREQIIFRP
jgi:hypothetical protein